MDNFKTYIDLYFHFGILHFLFAIRGLNIGKKTILMQCFYGVYRKHLHTESPDNNEVYNVPNWQNWIASWQ